MDQKDIIHIIIWGNSTIEVLNASMDGKEYTIADSWNINGTINDKQYKSGIYIDGDETDVCFGLTTYGSHTYQIVYKITNFVISTTDSDIAYWTLFPNEFNPTPKYINIKIYSDFEYNESIGVWGYGNYGGVARIEDGYVKMQSPSKFNTNSYMTVLIKFPKGTFTTNNTTNNDFNYYYQMSIENSEAYINDNNTKEVSISPLEMFIAIVRLFLFPLIILLICLKLLNKDSYDFGATGNVIKGDVPNYRDIPCNKDIYKAYFIAEKYHLNRKKEDLLGAILLKWLKNNNVKIEKIEKNGLFKTKTTANIILINMPEDIKVETKLFRWMYEASKDGKLETKEFNKWCSRNYRVILKWFDDVIEYETDQLIKENKIVTESKSNILFKRNKYIVDSSLMEEAKQLKGLKNYLVSFTRMNTKEPIEVSLWEEYLIYAQILGIADEVSNQFKKLYPEIIEQMNYDGITFENIEFISHLSSSGITNARRASSASDSGGGFSSGGGGGGSFGGGGGGGGFR